MCWGFLFPAFTHREREAQLCPHVFVDFNSAFNAISLMKLVNKLELLCLSTLLCNWILDFLINRPQLVKIGQLSSFIFFLITGFPEGYVLSTLLFTLHIYECAIQYKGCSLHLQMIPPLLGGLKIMMRNQPAA